MAAIAARCPAAFAAGSVVRRLLPPDVRGIRFAGRTGDGGGTHCAVRYGAQHGGQVRHGGNGRIKTAMKGRKDITSASMYVDLAVRKQLNEDGVPAEWSAVWWDLFEDGLDKAQLKEFRKWLQDNRKEWERFMIQRAGVGT